jgi:flagellar hook-associated protein 2
MAFTPAITTGGLASGLDTNSIIDKLVQIESQPITDLQQRQAGVKSQLSALGDIASKLSALQAAADGLATGGALGVSVQSSNTTFSATPASGAAPGSFSVNVTQLATNARGLSQAFSADAVQGGNLTIAARGATYQVTVADGASLADVAFAIRQSGAPVSATVLDDGRGSKYLSLTARDSGYPTNGSPADALSLEFQATGTQGAPLSFTITAPVNAELTVDGVSFLRASNIIADVIPGTTLTLKQPSAGVIPPATPGGDPSGGTAEALVLATDGSATLGKLQGFVDAYNALMKAIQGQLTVPPGGDASGHLVGDGTLRSLQSKLQLLTSTSATGLANGVRTLADLGLKTGSDGLLSINSSTLDRALALDASAVNAIFSTATTGMAATVDAMATAFASPGQGILATRQDALNDQIRRMGDQVIAMQSRVAAYRQMLVNQFAAMESVVSQMRSLGAYLTSQGSTTTTN